MDTQIEQNDSGQLTELKKIQNTLKMLAEEQARLSTELRTLVAGKATDDLDALAEKTGEIADNLKFIEDDNYGDTDLDTLIDKTGTVAANLNAMEEYLSGYTEDYIEDLAAKTAKITANLSAIEGSN